MHIPYEAMPASAGDFHYECYAINYCKDSIPYLINIDDSDIVYELLNIRLYHSKMESITVIKRKVKCDKVLESEYLQYKWNERERRYELFNKN